MIAIVTILSAFPLGYLLRSRLAANTAYAIAYLWAFVFQGIYLMLDMLDGGKNPAFTPDKAPIGYGVVTLAIFAVGFGLVQVGHWVRDRRESRQDSSCSSRTGTSATATSGNTAASANVAG